MLCKYNYMMKYRGFDKSFGDYQCDVADFKKWFHHAKSSVRCVIVWLENGETWLWTMPSRSKYSGWQKVTSSHEERLERDIMTAEEEAVRCEEINYMEL